MLLEQLNLEQEIQIFEDQCREGDCINCIHLVNQIQGAKDAVENWFGAGLKVVGKDQPVRLIEDLNNVDSVTYHTCSRSARLRIEARVLASISRDSRPWECECSWLYLKHSQDDSDQQKFGFYTRSNFLCALADKANLVSNKVFEIRANICWVFSFTFLRL